VSDRHPVNPIINAVGVYSWTSQARQYPKLGKPGIGYFPGPTPHGVVDCLLWRDTAGHLRGILNHYPFNAPHLEQKGNVNVWVQPGWQRRGIATALVQEAQARWGVNFAQQRFTTAGAALADALDPDPRPPALRGKPRSTPTQKEKQS
jgi:GNAT superfamily N-acetyltransferase